MVTPHTGDACAFLDALWPDGVAPSERILVWTLPDKQSVWLPSVERAASVALERAQTRDVYTGVGLRRAGLSPQERGTAADITALAGAWLDIDYTSPVHRKGNLPPDEASARAVLGEMPLQATVVVHSGHGLQAWWLWQEPYRFDDDSDRARVQALLAGWSDLARTIARRRSWDVDATHDLSRIMRVPGTWNRKREPQPVRLLFSGGPRYAGPSDLQPFVTLRATTAQIAGAAVAADGLAVDPSAEISHAAWEALCENVPKFRATWERKRRDLQDQSRSGYEMSLIAFAVQAGWSDQEIVNLCVAWRRRHGEALHLRADYYGRSIAKARQGLLAETVAAEATAAEATSEDREGVLTILRQQLGVPLARVIKRFRDPALYALELEDGSEIAIGSAATLLSQDRMRAAVYEATGAVVPPLKRQAWATLTGLLSQVTEVVSSDDAGRIHELHTWLRAYLAGTWTQDWRGALAQGDPFSRDGQVFVQVESFRKHLKFQWLRDVETQELRALLSAAGFTGRQEWARIEGKATCRFYWRGRLPELGAEPDYMEGDEAIAQ